MRLTSVMFVLALGGVLMLTVSSGSPTTAPAINTVGTVNVSVNTSGAPVDPDGYLIIVGPVTRRITINGFQRIDLRLGQ